MRQEVLHITIRHTAMFKVQPDTIETKVGRLLDKGRDVVPKTNHANRFALTNLGERLAFSHETSVMLFSISRVFVDGPGNKTGTVSPRAGVISNRLST
jgi:hypothetical protein